jgi:hypothetical protein
MCRFAEKRCASCGTRLDERRSMKITLEKNGSVTVKFTGALTLRQAIGMPKLIALFPSGTPLKLDFRAARWASPGAAAAVIPAIASVHRSNIEVTGLDEVRTPRHLRIVRAAA